MARFNREELQRRIEATGLSNFRWARTHGIVFESLRKWLNGTLEPRISSVQDLANALGCQLDDLLYPPDLHDTPDQRMEHAMRSFARLTQPQQRDVIKLMDTIIQANEQFNALKPGI